MTVTDEQLVAFLDGALSEAETAEIGLALTQDPELAGRLEALSVDLEPLQTGMAGVLASAPTLDLPSDQRRSAPLGSLAAAAAAIFAVGMAAGWALIPKGQPDWHQAVASYQVLYSEATVSAVPLGAEQREAGLAAVSKALGVTLTAESVAVEGLTFRRAQILEWNGAPLAQLVYQDADGRPIALCLHRVNSGPVDRQAVTLSGMNGVTWRRGDMGFIAIGPVKRADMDRIAERLWARVTL